MDDAKLLKAGKAETEHVGASLHVALLRPSASWRSTTASWIVPNWWPRGWRDRGLGDSRNKEGTLCMRGHESGLAWLGDETPQSSWSLFESPLHRRWKQPSRPKVLPELGVSLVSGAFRKHL